MTILGWLHSAGSSGPGKLVGTITLDHARGVEGTSEIGDRREEQIVGITAQSRPYPGHVQLLC